MKYTAILSAAGLSTRMGCDKLLIKHNGKILLYHAVDLMLALPVDERIIVISKSRLEQVVIPSGLQVHINPNPQTGLSSSVRIGIKNATGSHFLFLNADQPDLTTDDIIPMIELSKSNPDKIIYPQINYEPCSPTIFPAIFREDFIALKDDAGGRTIRDAYTELCLPYRPDHPEKFKDIDKETDI